MERLTNKREADAQREEYKRRLANKYPKYPRNIQEEQFLRLAAYEDTGLEPEEIKELAHDTTGPLHRKISEWIDAEAAGRLVVLPCGTDVELVRDGRAFKADHWNHTLTAFRDAPENKSGKQVALFSIKEAEAALKGGEG